MTLHSSTTSITYNQPSSEQPMTFYITPNTCIASLAQTIIDTCSRQKAAQRLADLYERQLIFMREALEVGNTKDVLIYAENITNLDLLARAHDIRRDMHVERLKTMPYRG